MVGTHTWATDNAQFVSSMFGYRKYSSWKLRCIFKVLCLRLTKYFKLIWEDAIKNGSKFAIYIQFKFDLIPEDYLEIINIRKYLDGRTTNYLSSREDFREF